MPLWTIQLVNLIQHWFIATVQQSPLPLLVVAGFAGVAVVLYGLTRGKEFLIAGYSSLLFLVPFLHIA